MNNGFTTPQVEQALVSALWQWPDNGFPLCNLNAITEKSFTDNRNRTLFRALAALWQNGKPIDRIVVISYLSEHHATAAAGGELYVNETLYECCHAPEMTPYYVELILERSARKELHKTCAETIEEVQTPVPVDDLLSDHERKIAAIPHSTVEQESMASMLDRLFDEPDRDIIKTKIIKLDQDSPFSMCNMTLISGMKKTGKTAFAITIAANVAKQGIPVVYYSLEDHGIEISKRIVTGIAGVPYSPLHSAKLVAARDALKKLPIEIVDSLHGLGQICSSIVQFSQRKQAGLVIIDYAQLVRTDGLKENREQQVAEVSRTLRLTALKHRVAMLLLCQLNEDGRTRESRALEQDCTAMWLLERVEDEPRILRLSVPYQRNGPSEIAFFVTFRGELSRIENYQAVQEE